MLKNRTYNRNAAVDYALKYALVRNPEYFNYTTSGGNCTNYISQCIYAGAPKMNFTDNGWYYISPANTSTSWANVEPLYNFLINNKSVGPYATISPLEVCDVGDVIQLRFGDAFAFGHSLIITKIESRTPTGIYVCANTNDVKNRQLSQYNYVKLRLLHILGYRIEE